MWLQHLGKFNSEPGFVLELNFDGYGFRISSLYPGTSTLHHLPPCSPPWGPDQYGFMGGILGVLPSGWVQLAGHPA